MRKKNLLNQSFGKLKVLSYVGIDNNNSAVWYCSCECGNNTKTTSSRLLSSKTRSCGCLRKVENAKLNSIYNDYTMRAKKYDLIFDLTLEEFTFIIQQNCFYCDSETSNNRRGYKYNGIDRIDSSQGYILQNSVPCCITCNKMKLDLSLIEFYSHLQKIIDSPNKNNSKILKLREVSKN